MPESDVVARRFSFARTFKVHMQSGVVQEVEADSYAISGGILMFHRFVEPYDNGLTDPGVLVAGFPLGMLERFWQEPTPAEKPEKTTR